MEKRSLVRPPDAQEEIARLAMALLRRADAVDVLPTPMDRLFEIAKVEHIEKLPAPDSGFLRSLSDRARNALGTAIQKIRGMADMRRRVVYVPKTTTSPRILFAKGHELGHQCMGWHHINLGYQDDDRSLSPGAKELFEQEANYFSAETIFQGRRFRTRSRDFAPEFDSIFFLADQHGASRQAAAWRFVEEQDVSVALVHYYPYTQAYDMEGNHPLRFWKMIPSSKFSETYGDIIIPPILRTGNEWVAARDLDQQVDGTYRFGFKNSPNMKDFWWQSWWNGYALMVLLRPKRILRLIK